MSTGTILIVSGGIEAVPGIRRARQLGLHVVVSDGSPSAPGLLAGDDRLLASTYDIAATVAAARCYHHAVRPLDGVISIASDVPLTVARVAAELGLPSISPATARVCTDKLAMKRRLAEHGVAVPWFAPAPTPADLRAHVATQGYPLVVKPCDSRGARGVLLLRDERIDLDWAHAHAQRESPSGRVMVEHFLAGPQLSTESLVVDGVAHTIGIADRNYERLDRFAPYVIEDGGQLPSRLAPSALADVRALIQCAADAFAIRAGVIKGDIVLYESTLHVIEIAPRLSGGYLCTHEIPLSTGVDFVGQALRIALGETPAADELRARRNVGVAQRWIFPAPGRVRRIAGVAAVAARPEVALCEVRVSVGDTVALPTSHTARAGVVMTTGATAAQAVAHARRAVADIEIDTESRSPGAGGHASRVAYDPPAHGARRPDPTPPLPTPSDTTPPDAAPGPARGW
ncbi:MAG TPA: ATP-grasp domain-containing protein [Solirubrobacteraceae bacterium]|jgi:biotin carboxylase|nr:ATP-grasp domain-containing protein [Solirubrobacteraceae bacterium]